MRLVTTVAALVVLIALAAVVSRMAREPTEAEADQIAAVLASTAPAEEPPAYAHCASCHLHDGSGRPDGSIPRLNGQRRAVLENKLYRLRAGMLRIPVMDPFARSLAATEIGQIAGYLSALPETEAAASDATDEERAEGAALYAKHCASCHGVNGEGHDGLFASRLCGQYPGYLERRLDEVATKTRGNADAVMQGVLENVPATHLGPIVKWLAAGEGCVAP